MSTNKNSIHILRGTKTKPNVSSTILYDGQLYFDRGTKTLQVGDKSNSTIGNNNNYVTVKDGAITNAKVANDAKINGLKLADESIPKEKLKKYSITDAQIASNAQILGSKLKDNSIKGVKLANANNDPNQPAGITTGKIERGSITNEKIADDAITGNKISETTSVSIQQLDVIKPSESTNPEGGLVRAEKGVLCGTWRVAGNDYIQSQYMPDYIYYHNVSNQQGKLLFPKRSLAASGEVIATLNNLPKFQSIDSNLYITT